MNELTITVDWCSVRASVSKHLAIMGKRLKDKDGSTLFANITLSSEEKGIMNQYISAAAETFASELAPFITYYNNGDFLMFTVKNSRWADGVDGVSVPFEGNFMGYTIAYVANAVLGMTHPDLAKKYADEMENHLNAAVKLFYVKKLPDEGSNPFSMKAVLEIFPSEKKDGYGGTTEGTKET